MALALPLVLLTGWWFLSSESTDIAFPPLSKIVAAFVPTWFEGRFVSDVLPSLSRLLVGYFIAVIAGIGLGMLLGINTKLRAFCEPALEFLRAIPPSVLMPVLMLFLGIGDSMKVILIAVGAAWPILLNTIEGTRAVDEVLRDTSHVYRFRRSTRARTLWLRGASPQIMAGARQALAIALVLMVISEMYASRNGFGYSIVFFQRGFAMPEMWTGILLLGITGVLLSFVFKLVERYVLGWYWGLKRVEKGL
jgi:ABC-type nitrate/sulfonate/bicarbonate transport system permease component